MALMMSIVVSLLTAALLGRAMLVLLTSSNVVSRPWWFGIGKRVTG
jgi:preprotein translocase subunit SecD